MFIGSSLGQGGISKSNIIEGKITDLQILIEESNLEDMTESGIEERLRLDASNVSF